MDASRSAGRLQVTDVDAGAIRHVRLAGGKGPIIDTAMSRELRALFHDAARTTDLKAMVLEGEGAHFSYGASVEEHLPETVAGMLHDFHAMFAALLDSAVPVLAAVRGCCLGGGLELAAFCHRVFASPEAQLGQPEIALGVFPPLASTYLRERVGRGAAEDLCLGGRVISGTEALRIGLVDVLADDPLEAALGYARDRLLPRSAVSLRHAVRAIRLDVAARFAADMAAQERLYLEDLMKTADAAEGVRAFLDKRPPRWRNA